MGIKENSQKDGLKRFLRMIYILSNHFLIHYEQERLKIIHKYKDCEREVHGIISVEEKVRWEVIYLEKAEV